MSEPSRASLPPIPPSRKRKRNLSATSIQDIIPSDQNNEEAEPSVTLIAPKPQPARSVTPPIIRQSSPIPMAETATTPLRDSSPIFRGVLTSETTIPGSQSPRSAVARRLSQMKLERSDSESSLDITSGQTPIESSSPPDPIPPINKDTSNVNKPNERIKDSRPPKKRLPPPRGIKSPPPKKQSSTKSPPSPTPPTPESYIASDSWLDLSALTWQDSEITGHLMLDPEDDGYGVNGIGFKPTPAMALARSRRRRQQVSAWRTREEREERERRAEKRRMGRRGFDDEFGGPLPSLNLPSIDGALGKKVVRFET